MELVTNELNWREFFLKLQKNLFSPGGLLTTLSLTTCGVSDTLQFFAHADIFTTESKLYTKIQELESWKKRGQTTHDIGPLNSNEEAVLIKYTPNMVWQSVNAEK